MKITLATLKKFIRDNDKNLFIKVLTSFDGMIDMVDDVVDEFHPITKTEFRTNDLGIKGLWLVGQSRDYFTPFENETFKGYEIYNCCGSQLLVIKK